MTFDERKDRGDYGVAAGNEYDDNVRKFVAAGRVDAAAAEARRSIEGPDGRALHDAEVETAREGAMPGDPPWMAALRRNLHTGLDRVLSGVVDVAARIRASRSRA